MDTKVVIALVVSGVILVLVVAVGLKDAFSPEQALTQERAAQQTQAPDRAANRGAGIKARTQIMTNKKLFVRNDNRPKVDPATAAYLSLNDESDDQVSPDDERIDATLIDPEHPEDIDLIQPPELSPDMPALANADEWFQGEDAVTWNDGDKDVASDQEVEDGSQQDAGQEETTEAESAPK